MRSNLVIALLIVTGVGYNANANPEPPLEGKTIFMSRCAACHNVNKPLTGPALAGVDERRSIEWIVNFVHSSQEMVKKGDKDAVELFEKFNRIPMPDHKDLSHENIKSIVEYIKSESKPATAEEAPFRKPGGKKAKYAALVPGDYWLFGGLIGSVLLLIVVLVFAARVRALRQSYYESVGNKRRGE